MRSVERRSQPSASGRFVAAALIGLAMSVGVAKAKTTICFASYERRYALNTEASTAPVADWDRHVRVDHSWWRARDQAPRWRRDGELVLVSRVDETGREDTP